MATVGQCGDLVRLAFGPVQMLMLLPSKKRGSWFPGVLPDCGATTDLGLLQSYSGEPSRHCSLYCELYYCLTPYKPPLFWLPMAA